MKVKITKEDWTQLDYTEGTVKVVGAADVSVLFQTSDLKPETDTGIIINAYEAPRIFSANGKKVWAKQIKGGYCVLECDMGFF